VDLAESVVPVRCKHPASFSLQEYFATLKGESRAMDRPPQSDGNFRLLVQGVKDYAILMLDPAGRVTTWNDGAERIKGYRADEILGHHFSQFYTPDAVAAGSPAQGLQNATKNGRFEDEGWRVRKDGSSFWANVVITALHDEAGQLCGFGKVTQDITERMETESKLRLLTERLSMATGVAKLGVWEWDLASNTATWDNTMFEMYGLPPVTSMPYLKWRQAVHTEDLQATETVLQRLIKEKGQGVLEFRIRRPDGALRNISATYRVVLDEKNDITRIVGTNMDVTQRAQTEADLRSHEAQMTHSAQHDFLTGLPNRMLLNDRIRQAITLALRNKKKMAVMFLDLDGFKRINDSLGHGTGDLLLQLVAKRIAGCLRGADTVGRQGGDEFVVVLSDVEQRDGPAVVARKMLRSVSHAYSIGELDIHVAMSIGVSIFPDDGLDVETLIDNADTAMYRAKENGRNSYQFFNSDMNLRTVEKVWPCRRNGKRAR
jgi:diguanylate cyclase (GGDEF)-like protein/PAS domain S-box-containing protein